MTQFHTLLDKHCDWSHAAQGSPAVARFHGWHVLKTEVHGNAKFYAALLNPELDESDFCAELPFLAAPEDAHLTCRDFCIAMNICYELPRWMLVFDRNLD
jgi:hypothetical protein